MTPTASTGADATTPVALDLERDLQAPPERVFRAWTDPQEMAAWFSPNPEQTVRAAVDLRVGGRYRIAMGDHVVGGEYREIAPPARLVFTWRWEGSPDASETLVTVMLEPHAGGTRLRLRHERFPDDAEREGHAEGWALCLPRLEVHLARGA